MANNVTNCPKSCVENISGFTNISVAQIDISIAQKKSAAKIAALCINRGGKGSGIFVRTSLPGKKLPPSAEITLGTHTDVLHVVLHIDGDLLPLKDKRSVHLAGIAQGLAAAGADGLHLFHRVGPVSYTHLDVYKRQGKRCAGRRRPTSSWSG